MGHVTIRNESFRRQRFLIGHLHWGGLGTIKRYHYAIGGKKRLQVSKKKKKRKTSDVKLCCLVGPEAALNKVNSAQISDLKTTSFTQRNNLLSNV